MGYLQKSNKSIISAKYVSLIPLFMNRDVRDIEHEIVIQILISELCFNICKSIPIIPRRGHDFLPFYYNLNFSKAILSLHSLLLSNRRDELSIKNYIQQYKKKFPNKETTDFEKEIKFISETYKKLMPISLRHKVCAHIDQNFKHTDFPCAYMTPEFLDSYISIVQSLKKTFFMFLNYSQTDYPFNDIIEQSKSIIKSVVGHVK